MGRTAFLTRRGGRWWFRRRPPRLNPPLSSIGKDIPGACDMRRRDHLALSLRTACPREARRRAARLAALFEFGWARYEQAMQDRPELAGANLQQEFAKGLIGLLRAHVDMVEQLSNTAMSEPARLAAQEQLEAGSRRAIGAAVPQAAEAPSPRKSSSLIDDPEFEAALLELADQRGWWQDDPDEIVEQFDWMLVGLMALQEEYVRYCARKKLDPASALPSIARLAAGLGEVAAATGIAAASAGPAPAAAAPAAEAAPAPAAPAADSEPAPTAPAADAAAAPAAPAAPVARQGLDALDATPISALALRYLDLRSAGYMLDRKTEKPHAKTGASFRC